ncbi:NEAT domain-containing protein [Clostridium tetani]|uniref:NEAT domain-containing protein n=1 Tax=Clostridium tetani TaxID=1513 RepID=UPI000689DC75|nr:NEAT domain-containing protein [Clostridium tetani]
MKLYPDINKRISIAVAGFLLMSGTHYTVKAASSVTNLPGLEINHGYNKVEAKNKSGLYELNVKTLKEDSDEASMAGGYLEKANYEIKDDKKYFILTLNRTDWMKDITATVDGTQVKPSVQTIEKNDKGEEKGEIRFEIGNLDSKVVLSINVVPMGDSKVSFKVVPEKNTVKLIQEYKEDTSKETQNTKPEAQPNPSSDVKTGTKPEAEPDSEVKPEVKPNVKPNSNSEVKTRTNIEVVKEGLYELKGKALKEDSDEISKSNSYIDKVEYEIKDGKKYLITNFTSFDIMKNIKVIVDEKDATAEIEKTGNGKKGKVKFEVEDLDSKVKFKMTINPFLFVNRDVSFDLSLEKDTVKLIKEYNQDKPDLKTEEKPDVKPGTGNKDKNEVSESVKKDINVTVLKEDSNEPSMAGQYIDKNVVYTEKDGKKYFKITVNKIDWMKDIKVSVDGQDVNYDQKQSGENADLTFEVNGENSEVLLNMNIVPIGNTKVGFRIVNSNSIKPEEKPVEKPEEKPTEKPDIKPGTGNKDNDETVESIKKDINVAVLKEDSNEPSMAGQYIDKNVVYTEKDGKKYFKITVNKINWMKDIKVSVDGQSVNYDQKQSGENADLTFEVNGENSEVLLNMNIIPMGNTKVGFRIVNSNSIKSEEKPVEKPEEKPTEKPDVKPEEKPRKRGSSSSTSSGTSNSQNGVYRVDVKILRDKDNTPSMAGQYVKDVVDYEINDNKKYIVVTIDKSNWLKNIDVEVDGRSVKHSIIDEITNSDGEKTSKIKFEVKDLDSKIKFSMNVEPMGNAKVSFRISPDKNSMKFTGKSSTSKTKNMIRVDFTKPNIDISENGLYSLKGKFLEENEDRDSIVAQHLSKNINYEVKNNKKHIIIPLKGRENDWKENIKDISIAIDGKFIKYGIVTEKTDGDENISKIKFEVPNLDSKIDINMSIIPIGNKRVKGVFQPEKDTFKLLKKYENGNVDNDKKEEQVENKTDVIKRNEDNTSTLDKTQKNKSDKNIETKGITNKPEVREDKTSIETEGNKLPQTGSPIGMGLMATLGMMLSGLGFKLKKEK